MRNHLSEYDLVLVFLLAAGGGAFVPILRLVGPILVELFWPFFARLRQMLFFYRLTLGLELGGHWRSLSLSGCSLFSVQLLVVARCKRFCFALAAHFDGSEDTPSLFDFPPGSFCLLFVVFHHLQGSLEQFLRIDEILLGRVDLGYASEGDGYLQTVLTLTSQMLLNLQALSIEESRFVIVFGRLVELGRPCQHRCLPLLLVLSHPYPKADALAETVASLCELLLHHKLCFASFLAISLFYLLACLNLLHFFE